MTARREDLYWIDANDRKSATVVNPDGTTIGGGLPTSLGQKTAANSTSVTIANDQAGTPFMAVENDVDISVKGSPGSLLHVVAYNYNATKRYLQIHNKATAPTAGNTPVESHPIPAGSADSPGAVELTWLGGLALSVGVAIGISTVGATFTAATTTDHVVNGEYV